MIFQTLIIGSNIIHSWNYLRSTKVGKSKFVTQTPFLASVCLCPIGPKLFLATHTKSINVFRKINKL